MTSKPSSEFISLGDALKGSNKIQEMLTRAKAIAESARNNSTTLESATKYECPDCQDNEILSRPSSFEGSPCHCVAWKAAKRRLKKSGIDQEFQRITFDDYKTEGKHRIFAVAKRITQEYVDLAEKDFRDRAKSAEQDRNKYNGMGLCGEPGSGKTTLLFALGNALLARRVPVLYFQHREEFDRLKAYNFDGSGELYDRVKSFPGVVLWDDLFKTTRKDKNGQRVANDWEVEASWTIFNYRVFKDLPIAFSTEWRPIELMNLDRSAAGRLIERCKHPTDPKQDRLVTFQLSKTEQEQGLDPIKTFDHRFMRLEE